MKVRASQPAPLRPTHPQRPSEPKAQPAPLRTAWDGFELPRRNDGLGGGTVTTGKPFTGTPATNPQEVGPSAKRPDGKTPAQAGAANEDLGSTRGRVISADEFTREAKVRALVDGGAPKPDGQGLTGMKDASSLLNDAARVPGRGAGKNATTRRGEQSDEAASGTSTDFVGPPTKEEAKAKQDAADRKYAEEHPYRPYPTSPEDRPLTFSRVWAEITRLIGNDDRFKPRPGDYGSGGGPRGKPNPEDLPASPDHQGETVAERIAARHRQVSQPVDGQTAHERVQASPAEALKERLRQRTDGRITPNDDQGATAGSGGVIGPLPEGSGIEQVDGTRRGDPRHPDEG